MMVNQSKSAVGIVFVAEEVALGAVERGGPGFLAVRGVAAD